MGGRGSRGLLVEKGDLSEGVATLAEGGGVVGGVAAGLGERGIALAVGEIELVRVNCALAEELVSVGLDDSDGDAGVREVGIGLAKALLQVLLMSAALRAANAQSSCRSERLVDA